MTHYTITQTDAEHAAIAATHAALLAVNSVDAWAPQTHLYGDLQHVLVAMLHDTYPAADASPWLTDLLDGATPAEAEARLQARHGYGVTTDADRQHWVETCEHVAHVVGIDGTDEGEPDEAFAWFCSCGGRGEWIHTDTEPNSLDAACEEGGAHQEAVGLPYQSGRFNVR